VQLVNPRRKKVGERARLRRSSNEQDREQEYHDLEDNANGRREYDTMINRQPRNITQSQRQYEHEQNEHIPIDGTWKSKNTTYASDIQVMPPLSSTILPSSRVASSSTKRSGIPKTLEVICRGSSDSGTGRIYNNHCGDDHSVVSAITMDVHLFQSCGSNDDAFDKYDDDEEEEEDLLPPYTYHDRSGLGQSSPKKYNRTSLNRTSNDNNTINDNRRVQLELDRRRRISHNGNDSEKLEGNCHNPPRHSYSHPSRLLSGGERDLLPPDHGSGDEIEIDSQNQQRTSSSAVATPPPVSKKNKFTGSVMESMSSDENDDIYFYAKKVVPTTRSKDNGSHSQEIDSQSNENESNSKQNLRTLTQQSIDNSTNNHNNRHNIHDNIENSVPQIQTGYATGFPDAPAAENDIDDFPSFIMDDNDHEYKDNYNHDQNILRQQHQHEVQHFLEHSKNTIAHPPATSVPSTSLDHIHSNANLKQNIIFTPIKKQDISDMEGILHCLNSEECNPDVREDALCKLFKILQTTSQDGDRRTREFILDHNVIEAATKSIWADMQIVEVQEAAMKLLLLIAASTTTIGGRDEVGQRGKSSVKKIGNEGNLLSKNESVCDSILFAMQNHATEPGIQLKGCLIFASLAGSSSDNNTAGTNSDGSLSGAMTMILNAMSNHGGSRSIRKAGLQALHHQCLISVHAENNKRSLINGELENGVAAIYVVIYAMEELQQDLVAMDWACQLCWCLTANACFLKQMGESSLHEAIVSVCQQYMTNPAGIGLVEASIGTIGNLAYIDSKRIELINIGAVDLVLDGLRYHSNQFGISYEAAFAMENFALPLSVRNSSSRIPEVDAVPMLVRGLKKFIDNPEFVIQGFRTLACMAAQSQRAKEIICTAEVIDIVLESIRKHKTPSVIATCSTFIATLVTGESMTVCKLMIEHGVMDLLLQATELSTEEKVQDATCLALRNLSCQIQASDSLLKGDKMVKLVVSAMELYTNSVSIQTSACCIFWNLLSKTEEKELVFNSKVVPSITKAMQSHIESGDLLEQACGALWVFVDNFQDQKVYVGNEVIDVVVCAMAMHPMETSTLENACGLMSNLSSEELLAKAIAKAQGVNIVAEAMRNNGSSISLLEAGCLVLKNITLVCPSFAKDGLVAISTLMNAMKENAHCVRFVKVACDLVWALVSQDENIRSKVWALDGISILMHCLEENSDNPEVKTSALRAFHEVAKSNN